MDWQKELDELRQREEFAEELGGPERVKRQHDGGRLTILERLAKLVDPGSFHEIGKIAGSARYDAKNDLVAFTPSNFVFGRAMVDGRPVVVGGDDFTVRGGSADATIKGKHNQCERMAHDLRLPLIRMVEGSGGGGSVKTIETTGRANVPGIDGWEWVVKNMATIPRVALGLGSVAGLGAAHLAAAHYSVMVKNLSALFVAGPAGRRAAGPEAHQERAGRLGDPAPVRRRRRRRRQRGRGVLARAALPLLHALVHRRSAAARSARRRSPAPRPLALRGHPARPAQALQDAAHRGIGGRPRLVLRGVAALRALGDHRLRAARRLARGDHGERPVLLRRRLAGRHVPQGRALPRRRPDVPPARRLSRRLPGLPHWARRGEVRARSRKVCA